MKKTPKISQTILISEWDYTKNTSLDPSKLTSGSSKKAWWKCKKGHSWEAVVSSRNLGSNCPYCSNRKISSDNNLQARFPEIAKQWNHEKNDLNPNEVFPGSVKKYWWTCNNGHDWKDSPNHRTGTGKRGCPYCSNRRVSNKNSLEVNHPELIKEIHPSKNAGIDIKDISIKSHKKLWWRCKKGHEWEAIVSNRTRGNSCPHCNSQVSKNELRIYSELKYFFPDTLLKEKIDGIECDIFIPSVKIGIEYDGVYWHKSNHNKDKKKNKFFEQKGIKLIRIREEGLPKIGENDIIHKLKGEIIKTSISNILLYVAANRINIITKSDVVKYQRFPKYINEQLYTDLLERLPAPQYRYSLEYNHPELIKEWNHKKNKGLIPKDVSSKSSLKVWWICSAGHEWKANISNRSDKGNNCPYCANQWVTPETSLATLRPDVAEEWNYPKNKTLNPTQVFSQSMKKVWWICKKGHEWEAIISNRTGEGKGKNTKCPYCSNRKVGKDNNLGVTHPELAKRWDFVRNKDLTPQKIVAGSNKKVWWVCEFGHSFQAVVLHMKNGRIACPECKKKKSISQLKTEYLDNWDFEKNKDIDIKKTTPNSLKVAFWNCKHGHQWKQYISGRLRFPPEYCPVCISLKVLRPDLALEWNQTKNGDLTPEMVTLKSNKKVWWICKNGHEWQETVLNRTKKKEPTCIKCK